MTRKRVLVLAVAVAALTFTVAGAMSAFAAKSDQWKRTAPSLVGSWDVTVTFPQPPPNPPVTARALATFNRDGSTIESASAPGNVRGASHGTWKRIGRNLFAMTRIFFRFNPATGAYLGTQKINATLRVSADGEHLSAVSISEQRDPAGNLTLGGLRATAAGTRIHVERIPDQP